MRTDAFLRTPLRADQQAGLTNLAVADQPLSAPTAATTTDPYPQSLIITFDTPSSDVEIAPLWEGQLVFLADTLTGMPATVADINQSAAASWPLTGDLVLHTPKGLEAGFKAHLSKITPLPVNVRYSKVRLTVDFLFTTLSKLKFSFIQGGKVKQLSGQTNLKEAMLGFLQGKTRALLVHAGQAAQDQALLKMPVVAAGSGNTAQLAVTVSSLGPEAFDPHWFDAIAELDTVDSQPLVPTGLDTEANRLFNPFHPAASVIAGRALYQMVDNAAFAPDHPTGTPLRDQLTAALPNSAVFRKFAIDRPPLPGSPVSAQARRQFPLFRLVWKRNSMAQIDSVRLPLSGALYLPLPNDDYMISAIPRQQDPANGMAGDLLRLTTDKDAAGLRCLDKPVQVLMTSLMDGQDTLGLYAHQRDFDSNRAWRIFANRTAAQNQKSFDIGKKWQVGPLQPASERGVFRAMNWFVRTTNAVDADYGALYGLFREAAGRHHISPEILQATFMGEYIGAPGGLILSNQVSGIRFDANQVIDSYQQLGLDDIYRESTTFLTDTWIDSSFSGALTARPSTPLEPRSDGVNTYNDNGVPADITGWEAAIEWMAAALQWRLDLAQTYCAANGIKVSTEEQRRYLIYIHFNTGQPWPDHGHLFAEAHLRALNTELAPWTGARPGTNGTGPYNTLLRVATAEWFEALGVYR